MERIKINLPDSFSFSTNIQVRITDINYGGHVGNDTFLTFIHEARQQFLQHSGYAELNMEGLGITVADAAIEYKRELKHLDKLIISVAATNFDKISFDVFYKIELIQGNEKILAAKAKTRIICFDYNLKKKANLPESVITKLNS
jgi:acyl-CoA thioester hydrolase